VTSGNRTPFHIEGIDAPAPGAPGTTPQTLSSPLVVEFQLRPDPLAHCTHVSGCNVRAWRARCRAMTANSRVARRVPLILVERVHVRLYRLFAAR